ncbi:MAG: VCBS repeat-containing protein [Deltaproteobacteria bacterium]|nr:VCBS repeat-containing protein [Deltaproteobacteria bacterium]
MIGTWSLVACSLSAVGIVAPACGPAPAELLTGPDASSEAEAPSTCYLDEPTLPQDRPALDGACVDRAPRPISPMPGAGVTTRRPLLRWATPGDEAAPVQLQFCRDRACASVIASIENPADVATPPSELPPGVVFWRVQAGACVGPTWWFSVPPRDAPVNTTWGGVLDVNGDGYADLVVTSVDARAFVYPGGRDGISPVPATVVGESGCPPHRWVAAAAGDVDGDGYGDLVVGSLGVAAYLYRGGPDGLDRTPTFTISAPSDLPGFGRDVAGAGDVNGDGYADFLVSSGGPIRGVVAAYLYYGGPTGPRLPPDEPWGGSWSFGNYAVAGAGDVNGDGYGDIIIGSLVGGHVRVYLGSPAGPRPEPVVDLFGSGTYYGFHVASAGDVNGDGYADVLVGAANLGSMGGRAFVYFGGADGTRETPFVLESDEWHFGFAAEGGDIDGDGYADPVVAASNSGNVYVFRGGPGARMLADAPDIRTTPGTFAWPLAVLGDVNGDGYSDIAAGGLSEDAAYVYYGGPAGLGTLPVVLDYEGAPWFGYSVGSGVGV